MNALYNSILEAKLVNELLFFLFYFFVVVVVVVFFHFKTLVLNLAMDTF